MMLERHIGDYHFVADAQSGVTMRWGTTLDENPVWAPVPELADISISNHCSKGCTFCYKDSRVNNEFLSLADYCTVLDAMCHPRHGNVFQIALGGGEPLEHPDFLRIIDETCKRGIVPNFTTNGIYLTQSICQKLINKVGAVALSISSIKELDKVKVAMLANAGIKTNIHYVLSNESIEEASKILKGHFNADFSLVNAIVFLTYKPAGRANVNNVLKDGKALRTFVSLIADASIVRPRIGFDACFVPMLLKYSSVNTQLVDTCEGAFFSVYIDHKMMVSPCSFSNGKDSYSLKQYDFYEIWDNKFDTYRKMYMNNCAVNCKVKNLCHGGCPYYPQITICHERNH